jgi:5'-3' exonuclease
MSFLGNDFLPHSLTVKIRDGGHDEMRKQLEQLHASGKRLVVDGAIQGACADFLVDWAFNEGQMLVDAVQHKYSMRPMVPRSDAERLMVGVQNLPIEWKEDLCLFYRKVPKLGAPSAPLRQLEDVTLVTQVKPSERSECALNFGTSSYKGALRFNWEEIYYSRWLRGSWPTDVAAEYIKGLQWILDYYTGKPISFSWYFPWNVPPTWADLKVQIRDAVIKAPPVSAPVQPQEQLAMVLPQASWDLVRDPRLRGLPLAAPAFWPRTFSFFSAGRRWMWECEPEIPVMSVERMRFALKGGP